MRPDYEILPGKFDPLNTDLICEFSECGFSFFFQDHKSKYIHGLTMYRFNKSESERERSEQLVNILNAEILSPDFHSILICVSSGDSILLPESLFTIETGNKMLTLVHGELYNSHTLTEFLDKRKIYTIYSIPEVFYNALQVKFPKAGFKHLYTLLLEELPTEGNLLNVIIYHNKLVLSLVLDGKIQIIQSFPYESPQDALYHILNTCKQFGAGELKLNLSGPVEKDSALYRLIHNYFLDIKFNSVPAGINLSEGFKEFPEHYFTHLFSIQSCE